MLHQILTEPEHLRVYRIGSITTSLNNRNAGNLPSVLSFLEIANFDLMDTGDYMSAFDVIVREGYGQYVELTTGVSRYKKPELGKYVGKRENGPLISYSFPENGLWEIVQNVGSIPIGEIEELLETPAVISCRSYNEIAKHVEPLLSARFR